MSVKIIQGEDRDITIQLKDGNGANLDVTSYTNATNSSNITACFVSTGAAISADFNGGSIVVNGSNDCGNITISLTAAQTALLDSDSKDFEIELEDDAVATKKRIVQIKGQLDIEEQIC